MMLGVKDFDFKLSKSQGLYSLATFPYEAPNISHLASPAPPTPLEKKTSLFEITMDDFLTDEEFIANFDVPIFDGMDLKDIL